MTIENPVLKVKKISPDAILPNYANDGDAGFDLYAIEEGKILSKKRNTIPLGIAAEIPKDWGVLFVGRSGLASKKGVDILGGLIDSGYRGEWKAILLNTGDEDIIYYKGDKVTQGVIMYTPQAKIVEVEELSDSQRGESGFGSTEKNK